jgi:hypothetical protein
MRLPNWAIGSVVLLPPFLALAVYLFFFYVDIRKIDGIPEIPAGELLAGHLYQLGSDHATTAENWSAKYDWPVFQLRMGYRRAVIINSFEAAREWLVKNQSATVDRPWFYTFHGVVSATSGSYMRACFEILTRERLIGHGQRRLSELVPGTIGPRSRGASSVRSPPVRR